MFIVNHPAQEPTYGHGAIGDPADVKWNGTGKHHRKFIERNGLYLNGIGSSPEPGLLLFWGEYEPASSGRRIATGPASPKVIHDKLEPVKGKNVIPPSCKPGSCINTDPYVFGDEFYYCCCKRRKCNKYNKGDIILFGTAAGTPIKFHLDTVVVVKETRDVKAFSNTSNYWKCALDPRLHAKNPPTTVIVGETYSTNPDIFSFVPSHIATDKVFAPTKPVIDVTKYGFKPITSTRYEPAPVMASSPKAFKDLLNDILGQGFLPAAYIAPVV